MVAYFRCHKLGHYHFKCYIILTNNEEKGEKLNYTKKKEVKTLLMAVQDNVEFYLDVWYVDTSYNNTCVDIVFFFLFK